MKHIVVDLEMNNIRRKDPARRICRNEIIEIGAVMLDENMNEVDSFKTYVKPMFNERIMPNITLLTGITDQMVSAAPTFENAITAFADWCVGCNDDFQIYAWSTNDYEQVQVESVLKNYNPIEIYNAVFLVEWKDFQKMFGGELGFERDLSLKTALDMSGLEFDGQEHDALCDARNTGRLMNAFRDEDLFMATLKKIQDIMKPKEFTSSLGSLFDFSAIVLPA